MSRHIRKTVAVLLLGITAVSVGSVQAAVPDGYQIEINGQVQTKRPKIIEVKGEKLYPLKWLAGRMGAKVTWDNKEKTAVVSYPPYQEEHMYLSYLGTFLYASEDKELAPLPERVSTLKLPEKYPLNSNDLPMLHQKPVGITVEGGGLKIDFAAYDYEFVNGTLYVSEDWLNTIFMAQIKEGPEGVVITYPTRDEITKKLEEIQEVLAPRTPQEALNLWIRGQQVRSGALQYSSLSPQLKKQVLCQQKNWVTGGSSPSAGAAKILSSKEIAKDSYSYEISMDEILENKVEGKIRQQLAIEKYNENGQDTWLISKAAGDLDYYTILGKD